MKNLKNFITSFVWIFIVCAILSSCSDEEDPVNKVEEGLPVSISFGLTTPAPNEVKTRATDEQETQVERLMLLFYRDDTSNPVAYEVPNMAACKVDKQTTGQGAVSTTNYFYNITVPKEAGVTSGDWYVYAIANWHKGFWGGINEGLQWPLTRPALKELLIKKQNEDIDFTETSMLLTGKYGTVNSDTDDKLTLSAENGGVNTLTMPIHLQRSLAKISVEFINGAGVEFIPESYDLYNYSQASTLFERSGWTGVANPAGNVIPLESNQFINKSGISIKSIKNTEGNVQYGFQFYMPENVQKAKDNPTSQALREKKSGNTFTYAPDKATYMVVHGRYKGPSKTTGGEVTANVDYILHLGDFSSANVENGQRIFNNFTVRRNTKYNFNVTVNGVDNIITEAMATSESPNEPQPGAEGDVMNTGEAKPVIFDAHYQTIIFKISKQKALQSSEFSVLLRTPKTNGNFITKKLEELKSQDINWIKFCKANEVFVEGQLFWEPDTYVIKYNPYPKDQNKLMDVTQLLTAMKTPESYNPGGVLEPSKKDGYIYIQAFVDEYFYEELAYNEFINADRRVLTMATGTVVSPDGNSTYTQQPIFSFEQRSIKTMYDLTPSKFTQESNYNPFGLETVEDSTRNKQIEMYLVKDPVTISGGEGEAYSGDDYDNGYANSIGVVDGGLIGKNWSTYVDFPNNTMQHDFDYGLYSFLLRNRDLNGDDLIQENEIKWFLPSVNQHIAIWNGFHALPQQCLLEISTLYFTSTNGEFRALWAGEGAFGRYKPNGEGGQAVRCIRALKNLDKPTSRSTTFDSQSRTFTVSSFGENAIRPAGTQHGEYPYHPQTDVSNKLPGKFQVASQYLKKKIGTGSQVTDQFSIEDIKSGNICAGFEDGGISEGWRVPNQRELMIMLLIWHDKAQLNNAYDLKTLTAASTYYDQNVNRIFYVQNGRGGSKFVTSSGTTKDRKFYILPVRDVR